MSDRTIAVVGGGPAGLMAAVTAASTGAKVLLLERNDRVGKKILTTGNGRCNLTNNNISNSHYHGNSPDFVDGAFRQFGVKETLEFFGKLGMEFIEEEAGRIFPKSQQAGSVLDAFRLEIAKPGIDLIPQARITTAIRLKTGGFELTDDTGRTFSADAVILACGGKAAPETGSDGTGYSVAASFGHTLVEPMAALAQIRLEGTGYKAMEGMKWDGEIRISRDGKIIAKETGDILFTSYGISGLAVLKISRVALQVKKQTNDLDLEIDFLPELSDEETLGKIRGRISNQPSRTLEYFFTGWLNKRIGQTLLKTAGLVLSRSSDSLTDQECQRICEEIHHLKYKVMGSNGWKNAQVTAGGISTDQVNPDTLESKLAKGLYFAGEILDIDGDSGGYNLQWAWSSGHVAGMSAGQG